MATNLEFSTKGGTKEYAEFSPTVPTTVQINRDSKGGLTVCANIDDMPPVTIFSNNGIYEDFIFQVDVPAGVKITIESTAHVISAKMVENE